MDIQPISNNKFIVGLSRDDMLDLDITYEEMDYSNIETRRVIWTILDTVRKDTGRDVDPSGNLMIEAAPNPNGGCLLMFTISSSLKAHSGTIISKINSSKIFEFENVDNLLDFLNQIDKKIEKRLFTNGKKYRIEITSEFTDSVERLINEYGLFVGKDALTSAVTHEHWQEI